VKKVIYTAITGNYDTLHEPRTISAGWDHICFTNNPNLKSRAWRIIYVNDPTLSNVRLARMIKILFYEFLKNYELSIWVDGKIQIAGDMNLFRRDIRWAKDFYIKKHPSRNCIYREAVACINQRKDSEEMITRQIQHYRELRYPANNGMVDSCIMVRKHTDKNKQFCKEWFRQVSEFSYRDQLSFNFVAWEQHLSYMILHPQTDKYFLKYRHT